MKKLIYFITFLVLSLGFWSCNNSTNPMMADTRQFTVTYHANEGSGTAPVDSSLHSAGENVTTLENTGNLKKDMLSFVIWNTKADGTGEFYYEGQSVKSISSDINLYARFFDLTHFSSSTPGEIIGNTELVETVIVIPKEIGGSIVTSIGVTAFGGMNITKVLIPDSVTSIGGTAFLNCLSLTSITLPNALTSIGTSAFNNCGSLTSITLPNTLTSIGASAFIDCNGLTSITLPNTLTDIEDFAFAACALLNEVIALPTAPPTIGTDVFTGNPLGRKIKVPAGSVAAYKAAANWEDYKFDIESL